MFLGALINYILSNEQYFREYVVAYTNAATLVSEDFATPRTSTACSPATTQRPAAYDTTSLGLRQAEPRTATARSTTPGTEDQSRQGGDAPTATDGLAAGAPLEHPRVQRDETLQHPRTVFQVLKRHYARYTPEMVAEPAASRPSSFL